MKVVSLDKLGSSQVFEVEVDMEQDLHLNLKWNWSWTWPWPWLWTWTWTQTWTQTWTWTKGSQTQRSEEVGGLLIKPGSGHRPWASQSPSGALDLPASQGGYPGWSDPRHL